LRIAFACLLLIAAPLAGVQAGEISSDHRGTWTENGECQQPRRIVITDKTVKLVEPGRIRVLTDGDEAVFNGETVINASLPAKKEEDPELAFSAKLVDANGEPRLVTEGVEDAKAFAGTYKLCKPAPTRTAAKERPKAQPRRTVMVRSAPRPAPSYYGAYPAGTLLGGLY
jgi:hypothetical protein